VSDTLTDAQIAEGLRLAGEYSRSLAAQSKYLAHFNSHYAAALREVQALREQVQAATDQCDHILRLYSSPLVGEDEAECVKRHAIYGIVEKIRGKVAR